MPKLPLSKNGDHNLGRMRRGNSVYAENEYMAVKVTTGTYPLGGRSDPDLAADRAYKKCR